MRIMDNVVRLKSNPAPFLENDSFWSELDSNQKEKLLVDGAKAEIDNILTLYAANQLGLEETRDMVMRLASVATPY